MSKSKLCFFAAVLLATLSQANAGSFRSASIVSIAPQISRTPGMLDVVVTFNQSCGATFVGLETSITNLDPPRTVAGNNSPSRRQVGVRVITEDSGRACAAADRRVVASFQVGNAG